MIIIFLDIDGVLFPVDHAPNLTYEQKVSSFDKNALTRLHDIIDILEKAGEQVGIVISSDWRQGISSDKLKHNFRQHAFSTKLIGKTSNKVDENSADIYRGTRIEAWLNEHQGLGITNFVIFDDRKYNINDRLASKFVHCTDGVLSQADINKAITILNGESIVGQQKPNRVYAAFQWFVGGMNSNLAYDVVQCTNATAISLAKNRKFEALEELISERQGNVGKLITHKEDDCCQTLLSWAKESQNEKTTVIINQKLLALYRQCEVDNNFDLLRKLLPDDQIWFEQYKKIVAWISREDAPTDFLGSYRGMLPIHVAAQKGHIKDVQELLEKNPQLLNQPDVNGQTALLWASSAGHIDVVRYLLNKNPQLDVKTQLDNHADPQHSRTACDWAVIGNHTAVAWLLVNAGAILSPQSRAVLEQKQIITRSWTSFFYKLDTIDEAVPMSLDNRSLAHSEPLGSVQNPGNSRG